MNVDAPHPWTLHDPGNTGAPFRVTDDNDAEVTLPRAWREVQVLRAERAMWRQQYERERVRVGHVLGWLPPDSFDGDESKQHECIAHMDTAAGVRSRIDSLRADLRDARDALGDAR